MARNICDCPNPPGGKVRCASNQMASCRVKDGIIYAECTSPPTDDMSELKIQNWVLRLITGQSRSLHAKISSSDLEILSRGQYQNPHTGELVTFRMPRMTSIINRRPPKAIRVKTDTDKVLEIIKRSKKGVDTATLIKKTGFNQKKIRNMLHRTYKQGKIKRVEKGIYIGKK